MAQHAASSKGTVPLTKAIQSGPVPLSQSIPFASLEGKTVLITGGAAGIGAGLATLCAHHGANIIVGDINAAQGTSFVAQLRQSSGHANHHFITLDVSDWSEQVAFFKQAARLSPHGGIDCVVANAGINISRESEAIEIEVPRYSSLEDPPAPTLKTLRVDLDGVLYTTTLALSYLAENPGSRPCSLASASEPLPLPSTRDRHLLLVSSIGGISPLVGSSVYCAAKHGVVGLFRAIRVSAPILHGVRVNMLMPQYVDTGIQGTSGTMLLLGVPKTQMDDVAEAAARLLSDHGIIGRALLVGARTTADQADSVGLESHHRGDEKGAIWDVYAHDFEQTDTLMRRVVGLLNLATVARGWAGWWNDLLTWLWTMAAGFLTRGR